MIYGRQQRTYQSKCQSCDPVEVMFRGEIQIILNMCMWCALVKDTRSTVDNCDTLVLWLTPVRALPQAAYPSRVSASCSNAIAQCYFSGLSLHRLASALPTLDCSCRSDRVVVDWSCGKLPRRSTHRIRSSARTRAFLFSTCDPHTRKHTST